MIEASLTPQTISTLTGRFEGRARALGERRAVQLARIARDQLHPWRSPAALWPGFGRERA